MTFEPEVQGRALLPFLEASPPAPNLHILCVEDNRLTVMQLQHWGQKIFEQIPGSMISFVGSMAAAIAIINRDPPPDFVVLDLTLPDSTNEQTISLLDKLQERVPLVILTAEHPEIVKEMIKSARQQPVEVMSKSTVFTRRGFIWDIIFRVRREWAENRYKAQRALEEAAFSKMQKLIDDIYGHPDRPREGT